MIKIKEGEIICDKCCGFGHIYSVEIYNEKCDKCQGTGKVNWIENIFGKEKERPHTVPGVYMTMVDLSHITFGEYSKLCDGNK
jgi:RecJ-like exonuclease